MPLPPGLRKSPMFSFFLALTEMAVGLPPGRHAPVQRRIPELGIAIGVVLAFLGLPIGLQAVPQVVEQGCDRLMAHRMTPLAQFLGNPPYTLPEVQHRGDCGSPLVDELTKTCKSVRIAESFCSTRWRPPPGARTRWAAKSSRGWSARCLSLRRPDQIVVRDKPVASATMLGPPRPKDSASQAAH